MSWPARRLAVPLAVGCLVGSLVVSSAEAATQAPLAPEGWGTSVPAAEADGHKTGVGANRHSAPERFGRAKVAPSGGVPAPSTTGALGTLCGEDTVAQLQAPGVPRAPVRVHSTNAPVASPAVCGGEPSISPLRC
jgi:hypothetical protein